MDQPSPVHAPVEKFIAKMQQEGLSGPAIDVFIHYYRQLADQISAIIPESSITPASVDDIEDAATFDPFSSTGIEALKRTAVVKLNGGLGTTMGLQGPKSLIKVKNGLSFLEISIHQIRHINDRYGIKVPLILMNSFFTEAPTREAMAQFHNLPSGLVETFLQNKFVKVMGDSLEPAHCPDQPALEWNPAGHGDLLLSLRTSGLLDQLLQRGFKYLFVSNIDNLGAEITTGILGFFAAEKLDFLMEVTDRTPMDRKGGHLALDKNHRFVLRESGQCSTEDREYFSDISRHRFFNTNNLWLNLESIRRVLDEQKHKNVPLIINRKNLNQLDPRSPAVFHLESALGSAITLFEKSRAVRVERSRFAPVKNCDELLLVWSDCYQMQADYRICINPSRKSGRLLVALDPAFFSRVDFLESRFPSGAPSLLDCNSFSVTGDVKFGSNITLHGTVSIINNSGLQVVIGDNTEISGDLIF